MLANLAVILFDGISIEEYTVGLVFSKAVPLLIISLFL